MSQNEELLSKLPACPVETTLTLIGNKWEVLILRDLMEGTKRFGELRRSVGHISQKVLTSQLRAMEERASCIARCLPRCHRAWSTRLRRWARASSPFLTRCETGALSTSATCQAVRRW